MTRKKLYAVPGGLWWASDNSFAHRAFPTSIFENRVRATSIHLPKPLLEAVSALTKGEQRILTLLSHIAKNDLGPVSQPARCTQGHPSLRRGAGTASGIEMRSRHPYKNVEDRLAGRKQRLGIPQPVVAKIASGIERLPRSKRRETFKCSSS